VTEIAKVDEIGIRLVMPNKKSLIQIIFGHTGSKTNC